jgi:segregation and condensation protein B
MNHAVDDDQMKDAGGTRPEDTVDTTDDPDHDAEADVDPDDVDAEDVDDDPEWDDEAPSAEPRDAGERRSEISTESVVEAILLASDSPLPARKIADILGVGNAGDVKDHIAALNNQYAATGRSFRVEQIAKGYQILTMPEYNAWLSKVLRVRGETKLTGAALETLAIIAYKQPVLRADIEAIRGVAAGDMVNRLREMNLVRIVGRAEEIGRPMLYGTTKKFLEVFGLASLEDLPKADELTPPKEPPPSE